MVRVHNPFRRTTNFESDMDDFNDHYIVRRTGKLLSAYRKVRNSYIDRYIEFIMNITIRYLRNYEYDKRTAYVF